METVDQSNSSLGQGDFKRKRHRKQQDAPTTSQPDQHYVCCICGDEALSYNFGVICCESCKAFYRRSLTSKRTYACANGGRCEINRDTRKFCPHCRMQKCVEAGMTTDPLTLAYLDAVRTGSCARRTLRRRKERASGNSQTRSHSGDTHNSFCMRSNSTSPNAELPQSNFHLNSQPASSTSALSPSMSPPPTACKVEQALPSCQPCVSDCSELVVLPKWRKFRHVSETMPEPVLYELTDLEYCDGIHTCQQFATLMQMPFSVEDLGPTADNMMPDDPLAMSRFPEATLRRYIAALKKVPEFQEKLSHLERFWMLRASLLRQQAVVIAYFGDPYERCFYGTVANGSTFRHPIEYSIDQFSRAGADHRHVTTTEESMMDFYMHIRERYPAKHEWPVAAAFLCIVKLFSPAQYKDLNTGDNMGLDLQRLMEKADRFYRKYRAMFLRFTQQLKDARAHREPSTIIDAEVQSFCDRLITEAHTVCNMSAMVVEQLTRAQRDSSESQEFVPLWFELNSV